jgi:hypothetical protein
MSEPKQTLPALRPDKNACESPHVFILGAGASRAALPNGDRHDRMLPLMGDLVDTLGLASVLDAKGIPHEGRNFELIYQEVATDPGLSDVARTIESEVEAYFSALEIPETATLYDKLVLSLREKDLIASFNWDPLLVQAYVRNLEVGPLPRVVFLHGNVAVGVCTEHRSKGNKGHVCQVCRTPLTPTKLLYPIGAKNYSDDPFISAEWEELRWYLRHAYLLTILGYSAPKSDVEARDMLKEAWTTNPTRSLAEVFIIDIRDERELEEQWAEFFVRNHYGIASSLDGSWNFRHARRSCDAFAMATLQLSPCHERPLRETDDLRELQAGVASLVAEERALEEEGRPFDC